MAWILFPVFGLLGCHQLNPALNRCQTSQAMAVLHRLSKELCTASFGPLSESSS